MKIVAVIASRPKGGIKRDDDFIDRLSNRYTVGIIVGFAVLLSVVQSFAKAIVCWCPKHFTGSHCKYANSFCWIRNTYHLPYDDHIPRPNEYHDYILYYQWLPIMLVCQAALFYAPSIVWHGLNQKSGVDADHILQNAGTLHKAKRGKDKDGIIRLIVYQMHRFLNAPKSTKRGWQDRFKSVLNVICCRCCGARMGNYLVVLYLFSKLLYIANAIGQLYLLNALLRTNYNLFGVEYFRNTINNYTYADNSPVFPKVSMCDFNVRRLGNVQRYTVQCTLPLNLFAEKMYVFLWFWMVLIAAISVAGFFTWFIRALFRKDRLLFIRNHLHATGAMDEHHAKELTAIFLDDYLKQDGAFLLRLIIHNTSNLCCTEITNGVYEFWKDNVYNKHKETIMPTAPSGEDEDEKTLLSS